MYMYNKRPHFNHTLYTLHLRCLQREYTLIPYSKHVSTLLQLAQRRGTLRESQIPICEPECKMREINKKVEAYMLITHIPILLNSYLPCC